jgi:hypothetical protein
MSDIAIASLVLLGPLLLAWLNGRQRRAEKREDYARQDEVAERATEVAKQAQEAATLLVEDNQRVAKAAALATSKTFGKLDEIHTLVNSNMTAAMQAEFDATVRELAMMREVIGLHAAAGRAPSTEAESAVTATESRIAELRAALEDRHTAQDRVDSAT